MRKIGVVALTALSVFALAACKKESVSVSLEAAEESTEEAKEEIIWSEQEKTVEIGDIVLADDSLIRPGDFAVLDKDHPPVAVIAGFKGNGTPFAVGIHRSSDPLPWTPEDSASIGICFDDIVCTQKAAGIFEGDMDGQDNWKIISAKDEKGAGDAAGNYPAFWFVNTYGETHGLTGVYASGWYMPDIAQLCAIYENREAVNLALKKIYELNGGVSMESMGTNWYWSSSQAGSQEDYAWFVHYFNGYAWECPKSFTNLHVIALRDL